MLITNKAQYTCHNTLVWLRVSLTCFFYVLGGGGGAMIFSLDNSTSLVGGGGGSENPEITKGASNERKK